MSTEKSTLELTISKYKAYVSNLEWNISKNVVTGDRLLKANTEISCYKEIIQDLEKIQTEIPTHHPCQTHHHTNNIQVNNIQ